MPRNKCPSNGCTGIPNRSPCDLNRLTVRRAEDPKEGTVVYDKNGDKQGGGVATAVLKKGLDIGAEDFLVV